MRSSGPAADSKARRAGGETPTGLARPRYARTGESVERPIVFVIDDDESVRRSLERLLRSVWLDVQTFGTAREFTRIR